jgi:1-acyl-sn-glycerol-3-phosphate acyltransferase
LRHAADPGFPRGGAVVWRSAPPLARLLGHLLFSLRVDRVPTPDGPVVFAANHFSHLDPVIAGLAAERPVRFLAVDELYGRSRSFDRLTMWLGAIPMTRTRVPFGPLKLALGELARGTSIGLFPEGVRVWAWGEREPKRGAAWLAHRAGVPLVPIAIAGTDVAMGRGSAWISRAPVRATVCEAILPGDHSVDPDPVGSMTRLWEERVGAALASP